VRARFKDATAVLAADRRPPVLYLRPFGMDRIRANRSCTSRIPISLRAGGRYEEWLARRMSGIGPFVTVGDPTEGVPRHGAARLYAHDAIWQAAVDDLLARAGTVILHVGRSPGLAWEVERVVKRVEPERVLLSMPLGGALRRKRHYAAFRARFDDVFPRGLPPGVRGTHFLYFDADWTPRRFGELGALPPLPRLGPGEQRAHVLRRLAPDFRRMWAPRWARVAVYFVLATLVLAGLYDPRYLVLAALGAFVVAIAAAPRRSPLTIDPMGAGGVRPEVAPSTFHSVPPPVVKRPRAAVGAGGGLPLGRT